MSDRRFTDKPFVAPSDVMSLPPSHPAMAEGRTLFPSTVVTVTRDAPDRLLVSGVNNRKLGKIVEKGTMKGAALFGLSLEERATCPADCAARAYCYGNGMQMARRHRIGDQEVFFGRLLLEIEGLVKEHGRLLIRLHVLGDFPNVEYVAFWKDILLDLDGVAVYGYTRRRRGDQDGIGDAIAALKKEFPERFAIRWSVETEEPDSALVVDAPPLASVTRKVRGIACPAQSDDTACCATCGLCWEPAARSSQILFLKHGRASTGAAADVAMQTALQAAHRPRPLAAAARRASDDEVEDAAADRLAEIDAALKDDSWIPSEWDLTRTEAQIFNVLARRSLTTKESLHTIIYGDDADGGADPKIFDIYISKMRPKLARVGITIETVRGQGYRFDDKSRAIVAALRDGKVFQPFTDLDTALGAIDVRPIMAIQMPPGRMPAELVTDRPEVRMVRVIDLVIENAYQRDLTAKSVTLIRKIVAEWSWAKFKPPIVAERGDGTYYVIDGQHTAIAAATHPQIHMLPVLVVPLREVAERAESFLAHNRDRIAVSQLQMFHAELAAMKPEPMAIYRIAIEAGARIPKVQPKKGHEAVGDIVSVTAVRRVYRVRGPEVLRRVIDIAMAMQARPITTTLVYGLEYLVGNPAFADCAVRADAAIAEALRDLGDYERAAQREATATKQNRYRALAMLVASHHRIAREQARAVA